MLDLIALAVQRFLDPIVSRAAQWRRHTEIRHRNPSMSAVARNISWRTMRDYRRLLYPPRYQPGYFGKFHRCPAHPAAYATRMPGRWRAPLLTNDRIGPNLGALDSLTADPEHTVVIASWAFGKAGGELRARRQRPA